MNKLRLDLETILHEEVREYASSAFKGRLYFNISVDEALYSVVFVPDDDYPSDVETDIVIAARVVNDVIAIDKDTTDKPLYAALEQRGIPRDRIVLRYVGEKLPQPIN